MRITTQMINDGARKAGLPIHGNSLLDYIKTDSSANTLLGALSKNNNNPSGNSSVNSIKKSSYEKLEKSAEKLQEKAEYFTKMHESADNQQIYENASSLAEHYNSTIKALKSASTPLNDYYRQMLEEVATENKESLSNVGITLSSNGTLSVDETKMQSVDIDTLKKAIGTTSTFSEKVAFLASRISTNAETNMASLSSVYGSSGDIYSAINNKLDVWG